MTESLGLNGSLLTLSVAAQVALQTLSVYERENRATVSITTGSGVDHLRSPQEPRGLAQ